MVKKNTLDSIKKRGPGQPKKVIDWNKFEAVCALSATLKEICGVLGVSDTTLEKMVKEKYGKPFEQMLDDLSGPAKVSLRRNQFRMAETNPTMSIWLGKQWLGQTDKVMAQTNGTTDDERFRNDFFGFHRNGTGKHNGNGHKNGNGKAK